MQAFKCGPDYIDPSYHERASGRPCRNLDTWMLSDEQLRESFTRAARDADIAVVEGVMGLFDGADWNDDRGSTAQIARLLGAAVLLVVDISGMARSAAAAVLGYQQFPNAPALRGVILNFAGSERHARGCAGAIAAATGLPLLGWLARDQQLRIPERHLGLVPGGEQPDSGALIEQMARSVAANFDLARIEAIAAANRVRVASAAATEAVMPCVAPPSAHRVAPVVAVARDAAFCFYYPENLELLQQAGAAIEFFSPLRGELPDPRSSAVYLGGGYPELHAAALSSNTALWSALQELHAADLPIFAECGGFMVLTEGLIDTEGRLWPMADLVPGVARMSQRLAALGYRHATALTANLFLEAGESVRGHEFRYSHWECDPTAECAAAWRMQGAREDVPPQSAGFVRGNLLASYLHVHFGQRPELARRFVARLRPRV